MSTLTINTTIMNDNVLLLSPSTNHTIGTLNILNASVPDDSTDLVFAFNIDVSELQHLTMVSTHTMTVETNNPSSPQETFVLSPGVAVAFNVGDTAMFAGDVISIYCTTASVGAEATLQIVSGET